MDSTILNKIGNAVRIVHEHGPSGLARKLVQKVPYLPGAARLLWHAGIEHEIAFWDSYFRTKGLRWADTYHVRLNPNQPLQPHIVELVRRLESSVVGILDVGAGPLTYLGKVCESKEIKITAVDPLADEYDKILEKYNVKPLVRTKKGKAERLSILFRKDTFDLVFARNCIDHSFNPERSIREMLKVVKPWCYVLMEHRFDEAENQSYAGFHQWNFFSKDGDFLIRNRDKVINMSKRLSGICSIECSMECFNKNDGEWLVTRLKKKYS